MSYSSFFPHSLILFAYLMKFEITQCLPCEVSLANGVLLGACYCTSGDPLLICIAYYYL